MKLTKGLYLAMRKSAFSWLFLSRFSIDCLDHLLDDQTAGTIDKRISK